MAAATSASSWMRTPWWTSSARAARAGSRWCPRRSARRPDRLEAALERGVLLDVLAVLVEGGRADAVELAAGEHGLEQVAGVHRALGLARADHGVQLVDEEDDLALGALTSSSTALRRSSNSPRYLAPATSAPRSSAKIVLSFRPSGRRRARCVGEALDDGGLAHAGLADQDRVVLGPAREDLDHAADLVVAADDGVELAPAGVGNQVAAVLLERLVGALGVGGRDSLAAPDGRERTEKGVTTHAGLLQRPTRRAASSPLR